MTASDPDSGFKGSLAAWLASLPAEVGQEYSLKINAFVHDLRQPLAQIQAAQELLRRQLPADENAEELRELLDIIRSASLHASGLVADFVNEFLEGPEDSD